MSIISRSDILHELSERGELWYTFQGASMLPMLREGKDLIHIVPADHPLKKYDVPLYRRSNGDLVLHRVLRVTADGYDMRGDNTYRTERGVTDEQIIGILDAFTRNGKTVHNDDGLYRAYVRIHTADYPLRWVLHMTRKAAGAFRRLLAR